jgi:hypothetical protein
MKTPQDFAEKHGITVREFNFAMLRAQGKIMRGEKPTPLERAAYEFALYGDKTGGAVAPVPIPQ